jgi:hypothetical protein
MESGSTSTILIMEAFKFLLTLSSVFLGAYFAFKFERYSIRKDKARKDVAAANKSLFTLCAMTSNLVLFKTDFMDACPHGRMVIEMMPTPAMKEDEYCFNYNELSFLLEKGKFKLVFEMYVEQKRNESAIIAINYRSKLHHDEMQPILANSGLPFGVDIQHNEFIRVLGHPFFRKMEKATEEVCYHVTRSIESHIALKNELLKTYKELFPNERNFFDFSFE